MNFSDVLISQGDVTAKELNIDLNNLVTYSDTLQTIWDELVFEDDVYVNGKVLFSGLISGVNLTQFCEAATNAIENSKHLIVNGRELTSMQNSLG